VAALIGIANGVFIGFLSDDPCTPVGLVLGPPLGLLLYRLVRGPVVTTTRPGRISTNQEHADEPMEVKS
jgi:hypothetical protein